MAARADRLIPDRPPFARALRRWRDRRRLSQLELAIRSGVSQRHLSFLELGRSSPSRDMVLRLGEALELPLRDCNSLLGLAGFAPGYRERGLEDPDMQPVREALRLMLDCHEPNPAMVVDRDWNVLMVNRAIQRLFGLFGDVDALWARSCGDGPRNALRAMFHPQGLRPLIRNWDTVAPVMLSRSRREAEADDNRELLAMLDELAGAAGGAPAAGAHDERPHPPVVALELGTDEQSVSLFSVISTFGTPQDVTTDEVRVETFFPADDDTARLLRSNANCKAS